MASALSITRVCEHVQVLLIETEKNLKCSCERLKIENENGEVVEWFRNGGILYLIGASSEERLTRFKVCRGEWKRNEATGELAIG